MHNEFLLLNNAKMANQPGPVPRLANLVEDGYRRWRTGYFLGGHYRSRAARLHHRRRRRRPDRAAPPARPHRAAAPAAGDRGLRAGAGRPHRDRRHHAGEAAGGDAEPGDKTALDYLELMDDAICQDLATPGCSPSSRSRSATRRSPGRPARHRRRGRRPARPAPERPRPGRPGPPPLRRRPRHGRDRDDRAPDRRPHPGPQGEELAPRRRNPGRTRPPRRPGNRHPPGPTWHLR